MHENSFFNKLNLNNNKQNTRGITLIALVITIIVLLILTGVSISMLTGQNGILTQAQNAKQATEKSAEQEKVQIAASSSRDNDGQLSFEKLKAEIENQGGTILGDSIPTTITINNTLYRVNSTGKVTQRVSGGTLGTVTGTETSNTTVQDALGNQVVVPAGFKVVNPNDYVTDGIIIEDVGYENTKGSQFVWIPVGDVKTADEGTVNIELNRYTFDENGTPIAQNQNIIDNKYTEINVSTYGNTTAKENIEDESSGFRKKAKESHGYYIGRYEARDKEATTSRYFGPVDNQIVCTPNNYVYNFVKQPQAANLARNMYNSNLLVSDLVNSYAWDTAILFLQTFDNRLDKTKPYSKQNSLNTGVNPIYKGTNILKSDENQDKICNVFDMAGNCLEWSTVTSTYENTPAILRGGYCLDSQDYTDTRCGNQLIDGNVHRSFRPILYL